MTYLLVIVTVILPNDTENAMTETDNQRGRREVTLERDQYIELRDAGQTIVGDLIIRLATSLKHSHEKEPVEGCHCCECQNKRLGKGILSSYGISDQDDEQDWDYPVEDGGNV